MLHVGAPLKVFEAVAGFTSKWKLIPVLDAPDPLFTVTAGAVLCWVRAVSVSTPVSAKTAAEVISALFALL